MSGGMDTDRIHFLLLCYRLPAGYPGPEGGHRFPRRGAGQRLQEAVRPYVIKNILYLYQNPGGFSAWTIDVKTDALLSYKEINVSDPDSFCIRIQWPSGSVYGIRFRIQVIKKCQKLKIRA